MKSVSKIKIVVTAVAAILVVGCQSKPEAPEISSDGLKLEVSTRSAVAYKKEGIDFSEFNKVLILPSQVAFKKDWQRNYNRNQSSISTRIKDEDVIRIKKGVAKLFDEIFAEELMKDSPDVVTDKAATGVLLLKPVILDLVVNAPDTMSAGMSRTYVSEAGQATLFLELYDSVSGEILARIMDSEIIGDNHYAQWATRGSNTADAKRTIRKWAKALITQYDKNHDKK